MADGSRRSSGDASPESTQPAWVRWLLPSTADLIFVAALCAITFTPLAVKLLGDAGIGWHIRTGQQILASHSIPRGDPFSSTMGGKPWFAWEWFYDVIAGALHHLAGLNGVVWFTAVVIAAVFGWMFQILVARGTNLFFALLLTLLAISASTIHFLARPHVMSWLFTLAWFWILDSTERAIVHGGDHDASRRLWLLPILMVAWVNVHGGFLVGFILLGIFWLGALWMWFSSKGDRIEGVLQRIAAGKRVRDLAAIGVISAAASLVNPYGWKLHEHIYAYLSNRFLMQHIEEFQPPTFHGLAQKCFLVLLVISLGILAVSRNQLRASDGLLVLFATGAGLYATRNIPISSIFLAMAAGPVLPTPALVARFSGRMGTIESTLRGHAWPILAIVATFSIAANGGRIGSSVLMDAHFDPKRMPVQAVDYLEQHDVHGPILSPDFWGGYLIYRLYPKVRVVVDDRHDLYGAGFLQSYLRMIHVESGWGEFLRETHPACVLLQRNAPLAQMLTNTAGWKIVYQDPTSIAFVNIT